MVWLFVLIAVVVLLGGALLGNLLWKEDEKTREEQEREMRERGLSSLDELRAVKAAEVKMSEEERLRIQREEEEKKREKEECLRRKYEENACRATASVSPEVRSRRLLWVGLTGMSVFALDLASSIARTSYAIYLEYVEAPFLTPVQFAFCLLAIFAVARVILLAGFIALMGVGATWRQSWLVRCGTIATGILMLCPFLIGATLVNPDLGLNRDALAFLSVICSVFVILPIFKMLCLVPSWARFFGKTGASIMILTAAYDVISQFDWALQHGILRYNYVFDFWFLLAGDVALFVFFLAVLIYRSWRDGENRTGPLPVPLKV